MLCVFSVCALLQSGHHTVLNQRAQFYCPAPERGEWIFVWMDAGTPLVMKPGGLKRHKWCVDNWGFVSKEVLVR